MKQYILKQIGENEPIGKYATKAEAVEEMENVIECYNDTLDEENDETILTPFDFTLEVVESKEVNETITTFDEARAFLGSPCRKRCCRAIAFSLQTWRNWSRI